MQIIQTALPCLFDTSLCGTKTCPWNVALQVERAIKGMKIHTFMRFFPAACLDKSFFFLLTARTHKADHTSDMQIVVDMTGASLVESP